MAGKVELLSNFIVTKANDQSLSIMQLVNITKAQIVNAVPAVHRDKLSSVIIRKAKQRAIVTYVKQKAEVQKKFVYLRLKLLA